MNKKNTTNRIAYIDSIKGIAAVLVVFCHWSCAFMPGLYDPNASQTLIEQIWRGSPLNIITNGAFSVQLFFVLSGLLITRNIYNARQNSLGYFSKKFLGVAKLALPGILFAYILMKMGLMINIELAKQYAGLDFFLKYNNFIPSVKSVILDCIKVFFKGSSYNGPLWTLHHELLGGILICCVSYYNLSCSINGGSRVLALLLCSLPFTYLDVNLSAFFYGAIIYDVFIQFGDPNENNTLIKVLRIIANRKLLLTLFILLSVYIACVTKLPMTGIYSWIPSNEKLNTIIRAFGIALVIFLIMLSSSVQKALENNVLLRKLGGDITIYLHIPLANN